MGKTKLISSIIALLICSASAYGQYYSAGQDPFSVKWRQIKTTHFQIIYPGPYEEKAQHLANLMELVYTPVSFSLDEYPGRMPLIMHEYSASSNAFVGWAPKRMEFYAVPPQDSYAQPWLDQLALHEQRHTVQMNKMYQGTAKFLSWILGQQGPIAVLGLYVPFWFLEGDATLVETALSFSGRGRSPYFENQMRAQILEKGLYSYDKAMFRSYRNNVPDQYVFGYFFVSQSRKKYGPELWDHTLNVVARKAYMIVPFNYGIKQVTGLSKVKLYKETFNHLKHEWEDQQNKSGSTYCEPLSKRTKNYTDYLHPSAVSDQAYLSRKSGIDDITRFVSLDAGGREKVIFTPGPSNENSLSYAKGKIYWSEYEPDPRWQNRSFSVVREYDITTGKRRKLSRKSRYFVPDISPDGARLAVVDVDQDDRYSLKILDSSNGDVIKSISTPGNTFFMTPKWAGDNRNIAVIMMNRKGKSLALIDSETGEIDYRIPFGYTEIAMPFPAADKVYFTGAYNGTDNIYVLDLASDSVFQLTSSVFGATNASLSQNGRYLLYSNYTSDGYQVVRMPLDSALWRPLEQVEDHSIKLYESISEQEGWVLDDKVVPDSTFETQRFRRLPHLFNIHSWAPVSLDLSTYEINPGVMFLSQNKLSTSFLVAGYRYNISEETGKAYLNYSYEGLYPIIDVNLDYGKRRGRLRLSDGSIYNYEWMETNIVPRLRVPLTFTRGKYYRGITPYINLEQKFISKIKPDPDLFRTKQVTATGYRIYAYHQLRTSARDLYPEWGQIMDVSFSHEPFSGDQSMIFAANAYFYFPGILKHHGLRLYAAYQDRVVDNYKFSDRIAYPRGYSGMQDEQAVSFSATYKFPLWYPDLSIPPLIYLKRIKMALFYDYAIGRNSGINTYYRSAGIDLTGDMHLLRFLAPFDLGVRFIYLTETDSFTAQFLIGVSFDSFYVGRDRNEAGKIY
jgi:hypothetical protein